MLTTEMIYNLKKRCKSYCNSIYTEVQRRIPISCVECATKSLCGNEFIIHVKKEYDYRFASDRKDDIIKALKYAFASKMGGQILPIYGIVSFFIFTIQNNNSLKEWATSKKNIKAGIEKKPDEQYRLKGEELVAGAPNSVASSAGSSNGSFANS